MGAISDALAAPIGDLVDGNLAAPMQMRTSRAATSRFHWASCGSNGSQLSKLCPALAFFFK